MNEIRKSFNGLVALFILREWLRGIIAKYNEPEEEPDISGLASEIETWIQLLLDSRRSLRWAQFANEILDASRKALKNDPDSQIAKNKVRRAESFCGRCEQELRENEALTLESRERILKFLVVIFDKNMDTVKENVTKLLPETYHCVKTVKAYDIAKEEIFDLVPPSLYYFKSLREDAVTRFFMKAIKLVEYYKK